LRILPTVSPSSVPRLVRHTGTAVPLSLRTVDDNGLEPLRYLHDHREDHNFLLRREAYRDATILLAVATVGGESFTGFEGSLPALGIRVVIAPGFGPVFFSEAVRQGILLVSLDMAVIERLADWIDAHPQAEMTVDLEAEAIEIPDMERIPFAAHPRLRHKLLYGLDDLDELLQYREDAVVFRAEDRNRRPWLYNRGDPPLGGDGG
jgi:3-isopropylmalate/(R)-2-methylmalate dehydratase small subunit